MRILYDFISSLIIAKRKISSFIIAPPESGKSYTLRKMLEEHPFVHHASQITAAGLRKHLSENPNKDIIVISEISSILHQRIDYSIFSIFLEAIEEGIHSVSLSSGTITVGHPISIIIATTPNDFINLLNKLKNKIDIKALLSRTIEFRYILDDETKKEIDEGKWTPVLRMPQKIVFKEPQLLDYIKKLVSKLPLEDKMRFTRNLYYLGIAFYEITADLEATKRFLYVLALMKMEAFLDIKRLNKIVYEGDELPSREYIYDLKNRYKAFVDMLL